MLHPDEDERNREWLHRAPKFLKDATNFDDIPLRKRDRHFPDMKYKCPICHGYGAWNLQLNAYGKKQHFQASCSQCNGWGWVSKEDRDCVHDDKPLTQAQCRAMRVDHWGMCCHVYICKKCKRIVTYDSSD